ncbi:sucrose synthase [Synechocystis sp. PCC 7339]|uniref:sucrose synthase n=1 Tax=unclassified Synechocystis TaxID=2640012 RepID=UPI001BAE9DE8|nr:MULTISPECIES: sucrose synthase [unclassified Synechocystis]QUS59469.1 sucrose synthase [Synechocystis sp. PCC 7338]UAJ71654.1 sucrose synthase [Synechocystis sp. PCC 7339]
MHNLIKAVVNSNENTLLREFLHQLRQQKRTYWLRNDIIVFFEQFCQEQKEEEKLSPTPQSTVQIEKILQVIQEIILESESYCIVIRPKIAQEEFYRLTNALEVEAISVQEILAIRDRYVNHHHPADGKIFEIDFRPFYDYSPLIRDSKNIGNGVQYLNRFLSSKLFQDPQQWLSELYKFLSLHNYNGTQLLINERIQNQAQLSNQIKEAIAFVESRPATEPYPEFRFPLQSLGFEPGWGNTAGRVQESLELLEALLDSPDHQTLEALLSRIPMIFRLVLVSCHGWFGQEGVLGRPDTGGQIVYVLDQAKSLEQQLVEDITLAGLDVLKIVPQVIILSRLIPQSDGTRCDERLEKVYGTENVFILRVPFRSNGHSTDYWISRFEIWPYLETFAIDAEKELWSVLNGRPDLIIGNYTDGNLIAFLLARKLKVTQCNVAHALEKSKYLFSNLYWQDLESQYHFSLQFTADLIAMNAANFIVSSTYQEITGMPDSVGQYESYKHFTMPDLYHVVDGIELFSPKFNVVPPGVNESYFFPYSNDQDRTMGDRQRLEELLFTLDDPTQVYGKLDNPEKRPLFSMARLDRIKNLTGLVEIFAQSAQLQEQCNLILVAGKLRLEESEDPEERSEIEKMYALIDQYQLQGKIRWLGVRLSKGDTGEVYRVIGDRRGIFVQPALFEAFGLTILEAMISGLPTFATRFGGPLEIIQDGENGFLINPTQTKETGDRLAKFVQQCDQDPDLWLKLSQAAMARVYSTYTWKIHTTKLLSLSRIYGFWNFVSQEEREDMLRYIEALFYLLYKPRANQLLAAQYSR